MNHNWACGGAVSFSVRAGILVILSSACATLSTPQQSQYTFPKSSVYISKIDRPFKTLGVVRTKLNYPSLDPNFEEDDLCRNYFNQAAHDLLKRARENGADAVVDMRSVIFMEDGSQKIYPTPECSDDGEEGQVLAQGVAVRWIDQKNR